MTRRPPKSPRFPYTTLFRSCSTTLAPGRGRTEIDDSDGAATTHDRVEVGLLVRVLTEHTHASPLARRRRRLGRGGRNRSEEHTSELQSHVNLVCRLLLEKKK